jgi:hypothetical protein
MKFPFNVGRHKCNCQATKHDLINNCLKCGRIVCAQEGSGPCFFCFNPVCILIYEYNYFLFIKNKRHYNSLFDI